MTRIIAYLLTLFPRVSETFILNEVVNVAEQGIQILPISLAYSHSLEPITHEAAVPLLERTVYVMDHFPQAHVRSLVYWLVRKPLATCRLLLNSLNSPIVPGASKLSRFLKAVRVAHLLVGWGICHVHAHWSIPCDVALMLSRLLPVTFSFTAHAHDIFDDHPLYEQQRPGYGLCRKIAAAQFVVTCTAYNKQYLEKLCGSQYSDKIFHFYHGLDPQKFAPHPRGGLRGERPRVISVGRLVAYKGFDHLVRACAVLQDAGYDFECRIVGAPGSQREPLLRQIADSGLEDRVFLLGPKTQKELVRLYDESDIYVNCSNPQGEYGVANVIVEAMAMKLATIATARPQSLEYLRDGENALVVEYGDHDALVAAMRRLLENGELRRHLGEEGRRTVVDRFNIHRTAESLADLFRKVVSTEEV